MRIRDAETANLNRDDKYKDKRQMEVVGALERAVRLNPFNAEYHLRLGWEYVNLWKDLNYHTRWIPAADISNGKGGDECEKGILRSYGEGGSASADSAEHVKMPCVETRGASLNKNQVLLDNPI